MKRLISSVLSTALVAAFALGAVATPAGAKACRDANGKFAKCASASSSMGGPKKACRDAKGHFVKCPGRTTKSM